MAFVNCVLLLALLALAFAQNLRPGGYTNIPNPNKSKGLRHIAEFVFENALDGARFTDLKVQRAKKQVVNGINYKLAITALSNAFCPPNARNCCGEIDATVFVSVDGVKELVSIDNVKRCMM